MRTEFEREDIRAIAKELFEMLKPLLGVNKNTTLEDKIYDVKELAEYLRVDTSWVYNQVSLRNIPHFKIGKYPRFKKSEIDKWINKKTFIPVPPLKIANK